MNEVADLDQRVINTFVKIIDSYICLSLYVYIIFNQVIDC